MIEDELVGGITDTMGMSLCKLWKMVKDREAWCAEVHGTVKSRKRLRDLTELYQDSQLRFRVCVAL